ncbi:MAG: glycosyl transferase [Candidatus Methylumidiphilus alinenensis]|uniref:Glycosyl transferase n=1 Tax=Candidatus Methylumidiphilus alinenensis TaxID=2202197 RepID=A0A2W4RVH9_9GAMM|nr:MAG: glycosyl transferase [Candidatus Methylumidiphilus alinenensis]
MKTVDIIVPVYAGMDETKRCLESVLRYPQATNYELIVINDQSPEPQLVEYLEELARDNKITLLNNTINLGFVGTVNVGMQLHVDRDVILLNSDTEPVNDWVDRLVACVYRNRRTGTATPFSNNATICSYPNICQDNTIPLDTDLETLDRRFKVANKGKWIEIPTAVGFCMYIRRSCLSDVGYFDTENFGKGYGEENDFCERAKRSGWKNVLCGDVFVYHKGNLSFGDSHNKLKLAAMDTLRKMHPRYEPLVHQHIAKDPAKFLRLRVTLARLLCHSKPLMLHISHNRGGGTERHLQELMEQLSSRIDSIVLRPASNGNGVMEIDYQGTLKLYFRIDRGLDELSNFLRTLNVQRIQVHHTIGIHPAIFSLPERLGIHWDYTIHDYYAVCPQINLIDMQGRYCGEPGEDGCNACLKERPAPGNVPIETWRANHLYLIQGADHCFTPSRDAGDRFKAYFPTANILTIYHEKISSWIDAKVKLPRQPIDRLRVVVIGALSPMKGADFLESIALDAKQRDLPIDFVLLGNCYRDVITAPHSNLTVIGFYKEADLSRLISLYQPDLAWFPALWPETYNYTLSAAINAGLPIVAPNIGAFPERLYKRKYTWIVPWHISENNLNDLFIELKLTALSGIDFYNHESYKSPIAPVTNGLNYEECFLPTMKKLVAPVDLGQFIEDWESHLVLVHHPIREKIASNVRYFTLSFLPKLKKLSIICWIIKVVPQSVQKPVKNWLLQSNRLY